MNYAGVKQMFTSILNRRDITPSQIDTFMTNAAFRIDREVRTPAMEQTVASTVGTDPSILVPGDLLEVISVSRQDQEAGGNDRLIRVDLSTILRYKDVPGVPRFYHRQNNYYLLGPEPAVDDVIYTNYYRSSNGLSADTDENWVSRSCPDLMVYGMLSYAADYFMDDRGEKFEARYASIAQALNDLALADELKGASIQPVAYLDDGYDGDF